jgi:hypothetical protein
MDLDILWDDQLLLGEDVLHLEQWGVVCDRGIVESWRSLKVVLKFRCRKSHAAPRFVGCGSSFSLGIYSPPSKCRFGHYITPLIFENLPGQIFI